MKFFQGIVLITVLVAEISGQDYLVCAADEHLMDPPYCPPHEIIPSYHPYPYDCTKFFVCTNGAARCIQCPPGTRWDQSKTICNHAAVIDCVIWTTNTPNATATPPKTTTTTVAPTTVEPTTVPPTEERTTVIPTDEPTTDIATEDPATSIPPSTTTPQPTTTTQSGTTDPADWVCPSDYTGNVGHPFDCTKYYVCKPGSKPCLMTCTDGLYFSPITQDCEWEWDVPSCSGGTPPPPTRLPVNYRNIQRQDKNPNADPCPA